MKKQRVLLITARSDIGGGPKYTLDFARALQADSTVYLASPNDPPYGAAFSALAEKHVFIPHRRFSLCAFFRLWHLVKSEQIDVIHSHGRGAGIYSRLLRLTGAKIIHSFHGIHREPTVSGRIKFLLDRILNPFTDGFVFVSESERAEAARLHLGSKRFEIVYAVISLPNLPKKSSYQHPIQLGSISRLTYVKGIDLLLTNLLIFQKKYPNIQWEFHLAGDGDLKVCVPNELRARVILHGLIPEPYAFLKTLDIYLANSRWESFNISVLEAVACHLPALISDVRGHEYFIRSGVARGFEFNNPNQFSANLLDLIQNKPESRQNWVKQHHSRMDIAGFYFRILTKN